MHITLIIRADLLRDVGDWKLVVRSKLHIADFWLTDWLAGGCHPI